VREVVSWVCGGMDTCDVRVGVLWLVYGVAICHVICHLVP